MRIIKIGRSLENDIIISPREEDVSKWHALLKIDNDGKVRISDLASTNGTYVNGKRLEGSEEEIITPDDDVRLGIHYKINVWQYLKGSFSEENNVQGQPTGAIKKTLTIGRNPSNTIVLPYEDVSGEHADIVLFNNGDVFLRDKKSTNGTTVNGLPVEYQKIGKGDRIVLAQGHEIIWEEYVYGSKSVTKKYLLPTLAAVVLLCGIALYFFKDRIFPVNVMEKYANSVVIIYHDYVYEVDLGNDKKIYLTKTEKGFELYEAGKNEPITITGTGFFVAADGKIMTNRHVALPWYYDDNTKAAKEFVENEIAKNIASLEQEKSTAMIGNLIGANINVLPLVKSVYDLTKITVTVTGKTIYLGVGLNDTYINSKNDLLGCLFLQDSGDMIHDVAMIQVKNKSLPAKVNNFINLDNAVTDKKQLKPGMKLIMIGYPAGFELGQTREGLKVNFEEGSLSRIPDDINFGHNLPAIPGASGSPIFNERGELIGINNQQVKNTQTFNMAILAKHVVELNNLKKE